MPLSHTNHTKTFSQEILAMSSYVYQTNIDATRDINAIRTKVSTLLAPLTEKTKQLKACKDSTEMVESVLALFESQHKQLLNCHSNLVFWQKKEGLAPPVREALNLVMTMVENVDRIVQDGIEEVRNGLELLQSLDRISACIQMDIAATAPVTKTVH